MLTGADKVLVTVLYLRHVCSQNVLADMLGITQRTLGPAIKEVRRALAAQRVTITPTTLCLPTRHDVIAFVRYGTPDAGRFHLSQALSDPVLTRMSRQDLTVLTERLSARQAALIEKRRHRQGGGPRQPGSRGGVFRQKITDTERILAAVLYGREIGTRPVLAHAFGVSLSTLNNALADALPVLHEAGITLPLATIRFRTGAELLASVGNPPDEHPIGSDTPTS
ncbi:hypothetical protein [Saccharothrix sp. NRRL B-16314]|uniref:hypothetical protein n=1 Tax=Saccharothrix sp. NRRL B-16314 TaxID=1463825 RepID=UPI00068A0E7D|nr:hypothetical protein [Saccharothrix sp. NRRL B-16314]